MDKIHLTFFAGLTDFYGKELTIDKPGECTKKGIITILKRINPKGENLLWHSRFASEDMYLEQDAIFEVDTIFILPPASGG